MTDREQELDAYLRLGGKDVQVLRRRTGRGTYEAVALWGAARRHGVMELSDGAGVVVGTIELVVNPDPDQPNVWICRPSGILRGLQPAYFRELNRCAESFQRFLQTDYRGEDYVEPDRGIAGKMVV